jgi:Ca2+-transporting ATPase
MNWHTLSLKEVFSQLESSEKGLSEGQAKQRLKKYGKNQIKKIVKKRIFFIFLAQFNSFLIYILIIAAIISGLIGHFLDAAVIGFIVILNGVIGFVQEYKAESIIEKLKKSLQYKILVLRDGKQKDINSKLLVPGDILILNEGDKVLADCRLIEQDNLHVNEAVLTGESFPVEKKIMVLKKSIVLAERKNMLYAGTTIVKGKAKAIIVYTGKNTEFGKLTELVQKTESEKMPLEKKLNSFSKKISIAILILVGIAFFLGVYVKIDKIEMFLTSISLAVGAIPEGLPAIIAITLAFAIKQMYKANTLIRKMPAAETLGRATVICTDKTGTLTEEELNVDEIYAGNLYSLDKKIKINKNLKQVLEVGVLCNNARDEKDKILGDPTEIALIKSAKLFGVDKKKTTEENPRVKEFAFSSERKIMSLVRKNEKIKTSYVKGAPDFILEKCTKEYYNGKIRLLDKKRKHELEKVHKDMASRGLRVLGFAFRQVPSSLKITQNNVEKNLIFCGLQGMIDPPRKEVRDSVRQAIDAGIEIKILTGDSALTTKSIVMKIGLKGEMIEGRELEKLKEDRWDLIVREKTIFARITPQQKLKIVEILRKQKQVVAVTGDGVNDILALKKADIGISMGLRGSDVARDSSDMVLLDDNFASIIKAVKEGRKIFDNMKKSIKFLLAANAADIFIIIFALLIGLPLPLLPLAILWMNLVTDSLPAMALAVEPAESDSMKQKPKKNGLLADIWHWILIAGILNFISVILIFMWGVNNYNLEIGRTMAITTAIMFEMFFVFSCKSNKSVFKTGIFNNKYLIYAVLLSTGLHLIAIYTLFGGLFSFVPLSITQLGASVVAGLSGLVAFEIGKLIKFK